MSVTKKNGFAAPYRSQTLQLLADSIVNKNGVISMDGTITVSGTDVTIPPISFIQNGLFVENTSSKIISVASSRAPFFIRVTAQTAAQVDDLIYGVVKSPEDITANDVIIAEFNGDEWITLPFVSIDGVYKDIKASNADYGLIGPYSGLTTSYSSPNYINANGVIVDKTGARKKLTESVIFPAYSDDPDVNYKRVDRVVYRRPIDAENRIGTRQLLLGGTFRDAGPIVNSSLSVFGTSEPIIKVKCLIADDNSAHLLVSSGYGDTFSLRYAKINAARTAATITAFTSFSGMTSSEFDAVLFHDGKIKVCYLVGDTLMFRTLNSSGVADPAVVIDNEAKTKSNMRIVTSDDETALYLVYQRLEGISNNQIIYTKLSSNGTVSNLVNINNSLNNCITPDIVVNSDLRVYITWHETAFGRIYYRMFDDVGVAQSSAILVSGATEEIGFGTLTDLAKLPKIDITSSESLVITFLQDKGGSTFRPVIWNEGSAYMPILTGNIDMYSLYVDPIHMGIHLLLGKGSSVEYVKIEDRVSVFSLVVVSGGYQSLYMTRDLTGSMLHFRSSPSAGTYSNYHTGLALNNIGPATVAGVLNTYTLTNKQFLTNKSLFTTTPKKGDQVTISGSSVPANNGVYYIDTVENISVNTSLDQYRITITGVFAGVDSPTLFSVATYAKPVGNSALTYKSTSEIASKAYRYTELDSDILLARIVQPGNVVLNYIPGGSGGISNSNSITVAGTASLSLASTNLSISGALYLIDLVNNLTYTVGTGTFNIAEGSALYVVLDGSNLTPTPLVTSIATLPFGMPIQVLGIMKGSQFVPHLLGIAGFGALESGEQIVINNDLPTPIRTKLGITSDTTTESYTSVIGSTAGASYPSIISQTNIMAGQNKHIKFIKAVMSWQETTTNVLKIHQEGFIAVPGVADARNRIAPQNITIDADGKAAYVSINRTSGSNADLTVNVSSLSSLTVGRDTIILARRIGSHIVVEPASLAILSGQRVHIDDPFTHPLKMKIHETDSTKIRIQAANALRADGSYLTQTILDLMVKFDGAVINTATGTITAADGTTALGNNYTVPSVAANQYRWFAVSLKSNGLTSDNQIDAKVQVEIGAASGASSSAAVKAKYVGELPIGQFFLQRNSGNTAFNTLTEANLMHLSPGAGAANGLQVQLDSLNSALSAILANNPDSEVFIADGIVTQFNLSEFSFSSDNQVEDIQVFADGRRLNLAKNGILSTNYQWRKIDTDTIEIISAPTNGVRITVYKQGTSAVSTSGGGSVDLTNITVDITPQVAGNKSLGTSIKPWKDVFLKDKVTSTIYMLEISDGVLQAAIVP